jgi:hypothetical protein
MKTMTTDWTRDLRGPRRGRSVFELLLRVAAALAWNAF